MAIYLVDFGGDLNILTTPDGIATSENCCCSGQQLWIYEEVPNPENPVTVYTYEEVPNTEG